MGEFDANDLVMFNSIKKQSEDEQFLAERAPLLMEQKAPKDWLVCTRTVRTL